MKITTARKGPVITSSKFTHYDCCMNPYVGCQFGCKYCYVRFFVKDPDAEWGKFVRIREHVKDKLPKNLQKWVGKRLVIGTMTDPYQIAEKKYKITRSGLEIIRDSKHKLDKVGIFTRSPLILNDLEIIKTLPRARVHFTIAPLSTKMIRQLEPGSMPMDKRFEVVKKIRDAGIRVHINVAPAIPTLSEQFTEELIKQMVRTKINEFYVDPMQPYKEAKDAIGPCKAVDIMQDKEEYSKWKNKYKDEWLKCWTKNGDSNIMAVWKEHETESTVDMNTGKELDRNNYGDN